MTLGERMRIILCEQEMKQDDFAKTLGVSSNYISLIVNNTKTNISLTLALLIQETYGYSAQWVKDGTGNKYASAEDSISPQRMALLRRTRDIPEADAKVTLAFLNWLEEQK